MLWQAPPCQLHNLLQTGFLLWVLVQGVKGGGFFMQRCDEQLEFVGAVWVVVEGDFSRAFAEGVEGLRAGGFRDGRG